MKYSFLISCLFIILFSCKKEIHQSSNSNIDIIGKIKLQLKDSISVNDFQQMDFNHFVLINMGQNNFSIIQIPIKNKSIESDFLLLKVEKDLSFSTGRFINIIRENEVNLIKSSLNFNGRIYIQTLQRNIILSSKIMDGYIDRFGGVTSSVNEKTEVVILPPLMPDVIIESTYPSGGSSGGGWGGGGYTSSPLYNLQNFLGYGGTSGGGGNYSPSNPYGGNGSGGGGGSTPYNGVIRHIDFEELNDQGTIDLKKYLACFDKIADQGSTCTITLLTDIPEDDNPNSFFNWKTGSPGHTFLQLGKKNGNTSIQQSIGFYPASSWKTLIDLPVEGRFADNGEHEFNASITMDITPANFRSTIERMLYLSTYIKYDIDDYNCTDFALNIFNFKRSNPLNIIKYNVPGGATSSGTSTPQGIYKELKRIKDLVNTESNNISIPSVKAYSTPSSGPCN